MLNLSSVSWQKCENLVLICGEKRNYWSISCMDWVEVVTELWKSFSCILFSHFAETFFSVELIVQDPSSFSRVCATGRWWVCWQVSLLPSFLLASSSLLSLRRALSCPSAVRTTTCGELQLDAVPWSVTVCGCSGSWVLKESGGEKVPNWGSLYRIHAVEGHMDLHLVWKYAVQSFAGPVSLLRPHFLSLFPIMV